MWQNSKLLIWFLLLLLAGVGCQPAASPTPTAVAEPTSPPATAPLTKIRSTNGEWPPYLSENLPHYGLASHIISEAFAKKGLPLNMAFSPGPERCCWPKKPNGMARPCGIKPQSEKSYFILVNP